MDIKISTEKFDTDYKYITSDLLLMEKHEDLNGEKKVTDIFTNCWAIGLTITGSLKSVKYNGHYININGQGVILVPPQALIEWTLQGNSEFSFKALLTRIHWPEMGSQNLYFINKNKFDLVLQDQIENLFFSEKLTQEPNFEKLCSNVAEYLIQFGNCYKAETKSIAAQIKTQIDQNITDQINLDKLSKKIGVSKSYLIRTFKKQFSMTPGEYIQHLRVYSSIYHMLFNKLSTTQAGFESGYENLGHYYKYFKTKIGVTPSSYKTKDKNR
ncbi:MAG: helix-turn-helix transcriptional regulator [Bdellovibrionales bacterium]|nr:helix-turn-helix transcriptional regulator [Bdellovibrionales bacterium]